MNVPAMPNEAKSKIRGVEVKIRYVQQMNQAPVFELFIEGELAGHFSSIPNAVKFAKKEIKQRTESL